MESADTYELYYNITFSTFITMLTYSDLDTPHQRMVEGSSDVMYTMK